MIPAKAINAFQKFSVFYQKNAGNTILFGSDEGYKKKKRKAENAQSANLITVYFNIIPSKRNI